MESAASLVSEIGYQATSIEKVAARARVGKTSIYRRWKSKSAMMIVVYRWLIPEENLYSDSEAFDERFIFLLKKLFESYRNTPAGLILIGLIADSQSDLDTMKQLKVGIIQERKKILLEAIARGIQTGWIMSEVNPQEAIDLVVAMVWHRLLTDRDKLNTHFAKRIVKILTALG